MDELYVLCVIGNKKDNVKTMLSMAQYKTTCLGRILECECDDDNVFTFESKV